MSSASLQNGVRVRLFLIILISIGVRIAREFSSTPVFKASDLLAVNYFLYGLVLLCTVAMSKVAFALVLLIQIIIGSLDAVAFALSLVSTIRCINAQQVACIHTIPGSIATIVLIGIIWLLDIIQCWSAYKIIQLPPYTSYLGRRLRILFSWAFPFVFLNNILLIVEDQWTIWITPHLVVDTVVIVMATSLEPAFLTIVIVAVIATDILAYMTLFSSVISLSSNMSAVKLSIVAQLSLSIFAFIMIVASKISSTNTSETLEDTEATLKPILSPKKSPNKTIRQRKSTSTLAF